MPRVFATLIGFLFLALPFDSRGSEEMVPSVVKDGIG